MVKICKKVIFAWYLILFKYDKSFRTSKTRSSKADEG